MLVDAIYSQRVVIVLGLSIYPVTYIGKEREQQSCVLLYCMQYNYALVHMRSEGIR